MLKILECTMSQLHCLIFLLKLLLLPMSANTLSGPPQLNRKETYIINAGEQLLLECRGAKNVTWVHNHFIEHGDEEYFTEDWHCSNTAELPYCSAFKIDEGYGSDTGLYRCEYQDNRNSYDTSMVYVQDSETPITAETGVTGVIGAKLVLGCIPTFPNIVLSLDKDGNDVTDDFTWEPTKGFIKDVAGISDSGLYQCISREHNYFSEHINVAVQRREELYPTLDETCDVKEYVAGIDFQLTCNVHTGNADFIFHWTVPNNNVIEKIPVYAENGWESTMSIIDPTVQDSGTYTCSVDGDHVSTGRPGSNTITVIDPCSGNDYVQLKNEVDYADVEEGDNFMWRVEVKAFPPYPLLIYRLNDVIIHTSDEEYCEMDKLYIKHNVTHENFGNYSLEVQTQEGNQSNCPEGQAFKMVTKSTSIFLRVKSHPVIKSLSVPPAEVADGELVVVVATCILIAYPEPTINWYFKQDDGHSINSVGDNKRDKYPPGNIWKATFKLPTNVSGDLTCEASNSIGKISKSMLVNTTVSTTLTSLSMHPSTKNTTLATSSMIPSTKSTTLATSSTLPSTKSTTLASLSTLPSTSEPCKQGDTGCNCLSDDHCPNNEHCVDNHCSDQADQNTTPPLTIPYMNLYYLLLVLLFIY